MVEYRGGTTTEVDICRFRENGLALAYDEVVTEEPLEIRVVAPSGEKMEPISVTMRTPGNDFELAAGFLFTEGIVSRREDIERISYCVEKAEEQHFNVVNVYLDDAAEPDRLRYKRNFYVNSSCGMCGKASIEAIRVRRGTTRPQGTQFVAQETIVRIPRLMRDKQSLFKKTGGIHASGLFDPQGNLISVREDIGRHNALDKLIGSELLAGNIPLSDKVLSVSGRTSFEIAQKALVAGIPTIVGVGAPSSLAVDIAREFGMTLIGFATCEGFNVYSGTERVRLAAAAATVNTINK